MQFLFFSFKDCQIMKNHFILVLYETAYDIYKQIFTMIKAKLLVLFLFQVLNFECKDDIFLATFLKKNRFKMRNNLVHIRLTFF